MTDDPRIRADRVLAEALELPEDERASYLADACGSDAELLARVRRLLEFATDDPSSLHSAALSRERVDAVLDDGWLAEGDRVGAWRVVREIGRGGMAVVYLAERADGDFRQRAALKVLKLGADTSEVRRRFEQERQILAALQHPAIAKLLDGGVTADGRSYFVLEHVAGQPIDEYCDERKLRVEERLRLFQDVGRALHYAHRNLVVHRDLKPSNVLVDENGNVKLLDFGIAKLLDTASLLHGSAPTQTSFRLMTPRWATPEQVQGAAITTATDVYQLGLLLYHLLTGELPYRFDTDGLGDIERVIRETPATRPSTAVRRRRRLAPVDAWETVRRRGAQQPEQLARRLAGDLDVIVLEALEKEPDQRYASALAMVDDIDRYLDGRPILARAPSVLYRARRFVGRHRAGVVAAGLLVLAVVAGSAGTLWQARRAAAEGRRAEAVKDYVVGLFRAADPNLEPDADLTVRALLDRGAERLDEELGDDPLARAEVLMVMGSSYVELGDLGAAEPLYAEALRLRETALGGAHPAVTESRSGLAQVLAYRGDWRGAQPLFEQVLAAQERQFDERSIEVGRALSDLCAVYFELDLDAETDSVCARAVEVTRAAGDPDALTAALDHQASFVGSQGDLAAAEALQRETLAITEREFGPDHPLTGLRLNNLAANLMHQGRDAEAEPLLRRALEISEETLGDDHQRVALALSNLGGALAGIDRAAEAIPYLERSVTIRENGGRESPALAWSLSNLGWALLDVGEAERAERLLRRATVMRERLLGPEHRDVAQSLDGIAVAARRRGALGEAEAILRRSLRLREQAYGAGSDRVAATALLLAEVLAEQGRGEEADALFERAAAIRQEDTAALVRVLDSWSESLRSRGLVDRAQEVAARGAGR